MNIRKLAQLLIMKHCNNFLLCLSGFGGGLIGFDRQRRKLLQLSASHSTHISTPTTSISGPGLHVDGCL